ncbi:uncharacterized protein LOC127259124 [Andrographis paniculata]|uniref:uncharacterized protein LOC127259124 n=1 Tax=Andrographis paniculata TaxID=175694 RepID=UPI0021E7EE11|nr:uncharacterized protein LOC127259124 [Andrographis paniculata]
MGNALVIDPSACFRRASTVKLIAYGGDTRIITGRHLAGEIMFEFPDRMICHADSFFIGRPIPSLAIADELLAGETYFLLPLDSFGGGGGVLSTSGLAALGSDPIKNRVGPPTSAFKECPFEYTKGSDGRILIKVAPAFIERLIGRNNSGGGGDGGFLCSTPELQKHYNQLVGSRDQMWSPGLETISEYKIRVSPCRYLGLQWKQKEG